MNPNALHPTATDGCEAGLHAFVGGRCRDCGALNESGLEATGRPGEPRRETPVVTGPALLSFRVDFEPDQSTRWLTDAQTIEDNLRTLANAVARVWTSGAIPKVTVEPLPAGPMPAERTVESGVLKESSGSQISSGGADALPLPTPTTARRQSEIVKRLNVVAPWIVLASKALAMDSAHVPMIAQIIYEHWMEGGKA